MFSVEASPSAGGSASEPLSSSESWAGALFFGLALVLTQPGFKYLGPLPGSCVAIATACGLFLLVSPVTIDLT